MTTRTRSFSRTLIAVTAATAPVLALAPTAQAAPAPPALPATPLPTVPLTPATDNHTTVTRWVSVPVANVRSAPSLTAAVVTTRTAGTRLSGTLTSSGWLRVSSTQYLHPSVLSSTAPSTSSSTVTMYMAAAMGNVRSGPGLGYPVVTTMPQGTAVRGTWTDGWLNLGNGRFISGTILTAQASAAEPGPATSSQVTRWVRSSVANARSGPSTSYPVTRTRAQGTEVRGTITSNGWLRINSTEYMAPGVLTDRDPGGSTAATVTQYVTASLGNVRSGPGMTYSVVTRLPQGTEVRGTWTNGWLDMGNGRFIAATILTSQAPAPATAAEVTRWVRSTVANARSGPSTSYPITRTRTQGTEVRGIITSNGWLRINSNEYMAPGVLTTVDPGGAATIPAATVTQYVTASLGNVRSGPGMTNSVVGQLPRGTEVRGTWTNGWLDMGNNRFIAATILSSTNPVTSVSAPAPTTPLRAAMMKTAADYVGHPYVLYGTPPDAFDCSSYTWWIYKQNGITIPRTVRDQRTVVTKVTDPQPGDLVFYNNWYHVGIYAGNGMVYEALNPSAGVVFHKMWDHDVWYGRVPGV